MQMQKGNNKYLIFGGIALLVIAGVIAFGPSLAAGALPILLIALVCPLMMLFMMGGMHGGNEQDPSQHNHMGMGAAQLPPRTEFSRDEQIAELKAQIANLQYQQENLARQLGQQEGGSEEGVRHSDERISHRI